MANIILPPEWQLKEKESTDAKAYHQPREFLRRLGLGAIAMSVAPSVLTACSNESTGSGGSSVSGPLDTIPANAPRHGLPPTRNGAFSVPERPLTERITAATYNNFYEFDGSSKIVWPLTGDYDPFPMTIEVDGLVEKEFRVDVEDLIKEFGVEERVYRFRCVEAWSMTLPWTGFALSKLIEKCKPLSKATHVAFVCVDRPNQMPGIKAQHWYDWPYYEGLRMDEAMNELAFVATGIYGEPLPKQHGSPLRLVLPWKYGYKGPKAVTKITFIDKQPKTFWNDLQPLEYSFLSNVNPTVPHPRWTQASERFMQTEDNITRIRTQMFNGYGAWVGSMYPNESRG